MVKKGGNGSNRGKFNQRGRPNGGGMNDFRNRSQQMSNGQRPNNGGYGNGGNQRPMSRFSNAQNGNGSYQPRSYNGNTGSTNQSYAPRSTTANYPSSAPKNGSYYDASSAVNGSTGQSRPANADQSKYNGFQTKSSSVIPNVYGQQHQSYMSSGISSLYNLPPPSLPFNTVQSVPFNYPPPVLPVKN